MATMLSLIVLAADPASGAAIPSRFTDGGHRHPVGQTFKQLAEQSRRATGDARTAAAQIAFDAFQRYTAPVNVQFPRCNCGRTYEGIDQWDRRRQLEQQDRALTPAELKDFKAACYRMLEAPDPWTRLRAAEHLVIAADHDDLRPLLALLKVSDRNVDRGLICMALGGIGDGSAVPVIAKELYGAEWERAAAALERIGGDEAIEELERAASKLKDEKPRSEIAATAARLKGRSGKSP